MSDEVTESIIGAAIEVHKQLGPGLLESIYEKALCHEFGLRNMLFECQKEIDVLYKGMVIKGQRLDLVVNDEVIVEIKSVNRFDNVFLAQVLTYLKATGLKKGLIINFNVTRLVNGIKRVSL